MTFVDKQRFITLWQRLGGAAEAEVTFHALTAAYAEPQRAYHTTAHLADCLAQFDAVSALADDPDQVEMAIWFHDAIYDPRAADNETRSAAWAVQALTDAEISLAIARNIAGLVLTTEHQLLPQGHDAQLLVDIDLAILGRAPAIFAEYNHQIRVEYQWVTEAEYRKRRAQVLANFLARPTIYQTEFFQARYEQQARQNLAQAIERLVNA